MICTTMIKATEGMPLGGFLLYTAGGAERAIILYVCAANHDGFIKMYKKYRKCYKGSIYGTFCGYDRENSDYRGFVMNSQKGQALRKWVRLLQAVFFQVLIHTLVYGGVLPHIARGNRIDHHFQPIVQGHKVRLL